MTAFIKICSASDWDLSEEPVALIKRASTGFQGHDLSQLVKRAGCELTAWVKRASVPKGETWAHAIAMSADEAAGHNRNYDTWLRGDLIKDAHTFETMPARAFRDHDNTDPRRSYGVVKKSWYNPDMHRVELIVGYNGTKEAADRNGGLVADKELEDLESKGHFDSSMATKIAHDICRICGNKAARRADYCDERTCPGGGMKKHAGRALEDGRVVCVTNHGSRFFDHSRVRRHADRTAAVLGKVASANGIDFAEMPAPAWLMARELKSANALTIVKQAQRLREALTDTSESGSTGRRLEHLPRLDSALERQLALKALVKSAVFLSPVDWLQVAAGLSRDEAAQAASGVSIKVGADVMDSQLAVFLDEAVLPHIEPSYALSNWAALEGYKSALSADNCRHSYWHSALLSETRVPRQKQAFSRTPVTEEASGRYFAYLTCALVEARADDRLTAAVASMAVDSGT